MKPKQFLKYLKSQGVEVTERTKHYKLSKGNLETGLTRSSSDVPNSTMARIKKKLEIQ